MAATQFEFSNKVDSLTSILKQILEFINSSHSTDNDISALLFKAKVITTELLTNSIKHSESTSTIIDIKLDQNTLIISKVDYGKPLALIADTNSSADKIPVTNDILHTLYARSKMENQIQFTCEENKMDDLLELNDIIEHFGLLIITKAADEFIYTYDNQTKENTFIVTLNL